MQGCDIAVENDGDVYVSWRTFATRAAGHVDGMSVVRSSDGGRTFTKPVRIAAFTPYFPNVGRARDCGDGPFFCGGEGYVFHRVPLEPRLTADQTGRVAGIFATWNAVDPASIVPSTSSYSSATPGTVGRSLVYVAVHEQRPHLVGRGRRRPLAGRPGAPVLQRRRRLRRAPGDGVAGQPTDDAYSVQRPIGNRLDAQGRAVATGPDAVATYAATSTNGTELDAARPGLGGDAPVAVRDVRQSRHPVPG